MMMLYSVIILNLAFHFPLLQNGIINWRDDDLFSLLQHLPLQHGNLWWESGYSLPAIAVFAFQYFVAGNGYFLYHAVSLLLHTCTAVVLLLIVLRAGIDWRISYCIVLLFSLHPFQVETIAWTSRQPLLFISLLMLSIMYLYHRYQSVKNRLAYYGSVVLSFLLFAITPMAGILILVYGITMHYHGRKEGILHKEFIPFLAAFLVGVILQLVQHSPDYYGLSLLTESRIIMAEGFSKFLNGFIFPTMHVHVSHPALNFIVIGGLVEIFIVTAVGIALFFANIDRITRYSALLSFAFALPICTGIISGNVLLMDSSMYVATIPFAVFIGHTAGKYVLQSPAVIQKAALVMFAIIILIFGYQSYKKSSVWLSPESYWSAVLSSDQSNIFVLNKIGMYYYTSYNYPEAKRYIDAALKVDSTDLQSMFHKGLIEYQQMDLVEAEKDLHKVLFLDPKHQLALYHLALVHSEFSRFDSAVYYLTKAIEIDPAFVQGLNNRGNAYAKSGNYVLAGVDFGNLLQKDPNFADGYGNRGLLWLQTGNTNNALSDFAKQLQRSPRRVDAHIHYILTSIMAGDTATALLDYSKVLRLDSTNSELYLNAVANTFLGTDDSKKLAAKILRGYTNRSNK